MPSNDHLWTHDEAARWLQVSDGSLKNARKRGEIEYTIMFHKVYYEPEAVRDFAMRKAKPTRCGHCGENFPYKQKPKLPNEADPNFPRYVSDPVNKEMAS